MKFLVYDSMMPDEPPFLFGECDDEKALLRLSARRGDSWTSTVQSAIAQRGAPSDLLGVARLNSRFHIILSDDDHGDQVDQVDQVDLIGGSSGVNPGQAPTAPNWRAEIVKEIGTNNPDRSATRRAAAARRAAATDRRPARRSRRRLSERTEPDSE